MDASSSLGIALTAKGVGGLAVSVGSTGTSLSVPVPFQNRITLYEDVRVAGTTHVRGIDAIAGHAQVGADLRFERESGNLVDCWAIKVYLGEDRIGYVPADCNEVLARLMDGGKALVGKLTSKEKAGSWNKLYMEVSLDD